jgi:XisI protein
MDKSLKYQEILLNFLNEYANRNLAGWTDARNMVVVDATNHQFLLMRIAWNKGKFYNYPVFHFELIGDKVSVLSNQTDMPIDEELEDLGIAKKDIIWGFEKVKLQKKMVAA